MNIHNNTTYTQYLNELERRYNSEQSNRPDRSKHSDHSDLDTRIRTTCLPGDPNGDIGSRIISLCEPVGPQTAIRVIRELLSYETDSPGTPIHMQIFSPGGCVVSGLAIIDAIMHISSPVFTYAIGYAASMGAVILACGKKEHRYILPHSRVMIHQASGSAGGTMDNVRATLAFHSELETDCDRLLASASGRSIPEVQTASRVDNWMSAKTAVEFGLVDHILESNTPIPCP